MIWRPMILFFFKKKFADFDTLDRHLKTWQALNHVQLKQRTGGSGSSVGKGAVVAQWV
jgi:hypothetical protein